jgi:hypothetical protein
VKFRTLFVSAAAGALVIAGPAATALADAGEVVLASSHEDDDDHGHSHDDDDDDHGHSHDDDDHSHEDDGYEDDDHSHEDEDGYDDQDEDAEVLPSSVDAGSGGLSTGALPAWVLGLMALGALGLTAPVAAAAQRRR